MGANLLVASVLAVFSASSLPRKAFSFSLTEVAAAIASHAAERSDWLDSRSACSMLVCSRVKGWRATFTFDLSAARSTVVSAAAGCSAAAGRVCVSLGREVARPSLFREQTG